MASPDTNVVGYYLCWGLASGQCTNLIDVGDVTNATLGGLTINVLYYLTVVAYDAFGDQAVPSNEIQYMATNAVALSPPTLLTDLTNQSAVVGASVSLQVLAGGSAPLSYHWQFNGMVIPGATANTLTLANLTLAQAGAYQVIVTNPAGTAASSLAVVTVASPPVITAGPYSQTVAVGSKVTLKVGVTGTGPFNYQWTFNGASIPGATNNPWFLSEVTQAQAGTYQVVVSGLGGAVTSSPANLAVLVPPTLVLTPSSQTATAGLNVVFQVGADGSAPLSYQWLFNGSPLSGATSESLNLSNVAPAQAGSYQAIVSNGVGQVASPVAALDVIPASSLRIAALPNGALKLTFGGAPNQSYSIQYSANVNPSWQTLATVTAGPLGAVTYVAVPPDPAGLFRVAGP